jgi:hypothetical protein
MEAAALSQRDEFAIENYADREMLNPQVQEYLSTIEKSNTEKSTSHIGKLYLNFHQEAILKISFMDRLKSVFSGLKGKVRKVFCQVVGSLELDKDIDWKKIIKAILLALVPAFAGGIPEIVLPIIIMLIAKLMKYGIDQVCPA